MTHTCPEREPFIEMFLRLLSNFKLKQFMPVEVFESVIPEIQVMLTVQIMEVH